MELAPDFDEFIGSLIARGVEFLVVGAYALAYQAGNLMRAHLVLLVCAGATAGCVTAEQWGLPHEPLSVRSPDQHLTAYVHNHASFDPPDQSIGVRDAAGRETDVLRLGPDSNWCDLAVWSGDSSTVAFLVQNARLVVVDARSARVMTQVWLVPQDSYPTTHVATDLALSSDGRSVTFRSCERSTWIEPYRYQRGPCSNLQTRDVDPGRTG
jgi:hypothetical protein